jgi:hypothetical protein
MNKNRYAFATLAIAVLAFVIGFTEGQVQMWTHYKFVAVVDDEYNVIMKAPCVNYLKGKWHKDAIHEGFACGTDKENGEWWVYTTRGGKTNEHQGCE